MKTLLKKILHKLKQQYKVEKKHGWFGNYLTWQQAEKACTGYDNPAILNKVKSAVLKVKNGEAAYERDSVVFDKLEYSELLLQAFKTIAKENNESLSVLDFGGSLGSTYFQYKKLLTDVKKVNWCVVEQAHFVECGKAFIEEDNLKFYHSIDEVLQINKVNCFYFSSVMQYFEKPYELLDKIIAYNFEYIIIDRTAFIENENDRITLQIVPEFIYKASYPAWFFNEKKFVDLITKKYKIIDSFMSEFSTTLLLEDNNKIYWKGFISKRSNE